MNDLDKICDFVLESKNYETFLIRLNFLLDNAVHSFKNQVKINKLPFFTYKIISEINDKVNWVVNKINETNLEFIPLTEKYIVDNIFLIIIMDEFPIHYENFLYQTTYIKN